MAENRRTGENVTMSNPDPTIPKVQPLPTSTTAAVPPDGELGPHAEPGDREEVYFEGSPPVRAFAGMVGLDFLITAGLVAAAAWILIKHTGPWWVAAILIAAVVLFQLILKFIARSTRYRIGNYRIDYERGLFSKNIDTLELWHVEDLHFHQSLLDRMMEIGTITITSRDETMPKLVIAGIPHPRPLYETLKQRVIAVKRQRGVIKMDPG
jgi:membrane protein YdbS with pleckstrin-like domain